MSMLPIFAWFDETWIGSGIRQSTWIFPILEVVHLLGLVVLLGTIVVIDMRLLGLGLRRQSVSKVAGDLAPFTWTALAVMFTTGMFLFMSEALKCYGNPAFWIKMGFFAAAVVFQITIYRRVTRSDGVARLWAGVTAVASVVLWFGVGIAGRAIGFI
jgi:hypothetical protein